MSLLDKLIGGKGLSKDLNGPEAFAGILVAAMAADGYAADEEVRTLRDDLYRMQLFKGYDEEHLAKMLDKLLGILNQQGDESLFLAAQAALPPELKDTAFAVAADMVLTDGTLADEEQVFLDRLRDALAVSAETAEMLVQAMAIKNRG